MEADLTKCNYRIGELLKIQAEIMEKINASNRELEIL